ncbi:HAD family hydrolase [Nocardia nova]|uniref:HAD family hydrolase n=1 Tax=Nocardia nova TaxID=37330 RepID=UPI0037A2FD0D
MSGLSALLNSRRTLLLDFDGPICAVFSGLTNREASEQLLSHLGGPVPDEIAGTADPFDVLRYAVSIGPETGRRIDREFSLIELQAVAIARPTSGAGDAIRSAASSGYSIAIVSNNSVGAISSYLAKHELSQYVSGIFGRTSSDLSKLKPSPYLLNAAISSLSVEPKDAVFVGDSTTDIQAARSAEVACVALANRPEKLDRFAAYSPDAVITHMTALVEALRLKA